MNYSVSISPGVYVTIDQDEYRDADVTALELIATIKINQATPEQRLDIIRTGIARAIRIGDNDGLNYMRDLIARREDLLALFERSIPDLSPDTLQKIAHECAMGLVSEEMSDAEKAERGAS